MTDLEWTVPEGSPAEKADTGGKCLVLLRGLDMGMNCSDDLKINLKSVYKELERAPKTNVSRTQHSCKFLLFFSLAGHFYSPLEKHSQARKRIPARAIETATGSVDFALVSRIASDISDSLFVCLSTARLD